MRRWHRVMTITALPAATKPTRDRTRVLWVACGAHALHDGFTDTLYVLLPLWQAQFALSYAAIGILRALYSGVMAGLQVPVAGAAQRIGGATPCGRHRSGSSGLFVSRRKLKCRHAGDSTRTRRHRLEHPAPDCLQPRRRCLRRASLAWGAWHLQLCRRSGKDGSAFAHRWPDRGNVLAFGCVDHWRDRSRGSGHHLAAAAIRPDGKCAYTC